MAFNPPEITLEINSGTLTIRTAEAIYHVMVVGDGLPAQSVPVRPAALLPASAPATALLALNEPPVGLDSQVQGAKGAPEDEEYYRELSNDMYKEVGRLARRLSMSIRDVTVDKMEGLDSAGDRLENAKDELENVVKMTEQATLKIMDLTEGIQDSVDKTKKIMAQIQTVESQGETPSEQVPATDLSGLKNYLDSLRAAPLRDVLAKAEELVASLESPSPAAAAPAPKPAGQEYDFPLDLVFQTMYELCTNEAVKKHIKAMWDTAAQTFDPIKLGAGLNQVAAAGGGPDEDNFLNLGLKEVLKTMFQATAKDNFQQILKKMASTADQIFLEPSLPLEAMPKVEVSAPAAAVSNPAPASSSDALALANILLAALREKADSLAPPELPELNSLGSGSGSQVSPELIKQLQESMGEIFNHVNGIVTALSFQDLSGQTIYKTVKMLTDFQVQILALVVGFGSKLKSKVEAPQKVDSVQTEKMAQQEVDKALASVGATEEDGDVSQLNQNSINSLLGSLGF